MQPNVVVLLLDATRADHLSCYDHDRPTTPFLDELAEGATVYDRAYAQSIWTLPSYSAIFPGAYPSEHGAIDWNRSLSNNRLLETVDEAGYVSHAISPHLAGTEGFGVREAFDDVEEVTVRSRDLLFPEDPVFEEMEERRKADRYDSRLRRYLAAAKLAVEERSLVSAPNFLYHQYQLLRRRRGWWQDNGASTTLSRAESFVESTDRPYFLFMDFLEAHQPTRPPRQYVYEYLPDDVPVERMNEIIDDNHIRLTVTDEEGHEDRRRVLAGLYDATIKYLDDQIRSFYQTLERVGDAEETVFVVLADHGDLFGEWGLWGHQGRIHNRLCHVPLVINYPWSDGRHESGVTELRDLCGHLGELVDGVDPDTGPELEPQGTAVTEYFGLDTQVSITPWEEYESATEREWGAYQASVVRDRWRLLWDANDTVELYDVVADPDETTDLADEHPEVCAELQDAIVERVGRPQTNHEAYRGDSETDQFALDEDTTDHLEELGYL
jgi:arylsulfatase A-like enzyme